MKNLYILLLSNLIILNLAGQNLLSDCDHSAITKTFEAKLTSNIINPRTKFQEKCFTKDWCSGSIILYNNEIVKCKYLKYNGFDDSFIWLAPPNLQHTRIDRALIKEVSLKLTFYGDSLRFRQMKIKQMLSNDSVIVFLNVLVEGKISLFVYRKYSYFKNNDGYEPDYQYFIKKQDGLMYRFKPYRYTLLAQFPQKKKELRKIIRKNNLLIRKENDLIKAIQLFNLEM